MTYLYYTSQQGHCSFAFLSLNFLILFLLLQLLAASFLYYMEVVRFVICHAYDSCYLNRHIYTGGEEWLEFPDLWSGQKPWYNWYLIPVVNFGVIRKAQLPQLAKSTLFTSTLDPWDLFRSFKVCPDAKERKRERERESGVWKSRGSYRTYSSPVKRQPWFLSLGCKTCLWTELHEALVLSLQWKTCSWTEHSDDEIYTEWTIQN